jgi:coproporphyrinogen III oxidase-like Fe-S oxidoreductase
MGVQAFDDALLARLGRIHSREGALRSFDILRRGGFENINLDLMFAIPGQTLEIWRDTLRQALALGSEHLSCYELIYEEDTPLYKQLQAGQLSVDEDLSCSMYEELLEQAARHGFEQYEIANFARQNKSRLPSPPRSEHGFGASLGAALPLSPPAGSLAMNLKAVVARTGSPPCRGLPIRDTADCQSAVVSTASRAQSTTTVGQGILSRSDGMRGRSELPSQTFPSSHSGGFDNIPTHACRHNINYWRGGSYIGLGPSAAGHVRGLRTKNCANTILYCEQLEQGKRPIEWREKLPPLAWAGETAAFGLRMNAGWPFALFQRVTGFDLRTQWKTEVDQLVAQDWGHADRERFRLTLRGLRFADAAAELFLR